MISPRSPPWEGVPYPTKARHDVRRLLHRATRCLELLGLCAMPSAALPLHDPVASHLGTARFTSARPDEEPSLAPAPAAVAAADESGDGHAIVVGSGGSLGFTQGEFSALSTLKVHDSLALLRAGAGGARGAKAVSSAVDADLFNGDGSERPRRLPRAPDTASLDIDASEILRTLPPPLAAVLAPSASRGVGGYLEPLCRSLAAHAGSHAHAPTSGAGANDRGWVPPECASPHPRPPRNPYPPRLATLRPPPRNPPPPRLSRESKPPHRHARLHLEAVAVALRKCQPPLPAAVVAISASELVPVATLLGRAEAAAAQQARLEAEVS